MLLKVTVTGQWARLQKAKVPLDTAAGNGRV